MSDKPRSKQQEQIMPSPTNPVPTIDNSNSLPILKALARERSLLAGLGAMQKEMGNIFAITMPGFQPIVLLPGEKVEHENTLVLRNCELVGEEDGKKVLL